MGANMDYFSDELNKKLPYAFGNELEWLRETGDSLRTYPPSSIVMIGVGPAVHALALFEGLKTHTVLFYAIDIVPSDTAEKHLQQIGYDGVIIYYTGRSQEVEIEVRKIDLLIVDGDHSYAGVKGDIEHWWTKVKNDGLVFFHDVIDLEVNGTNGVKKAIDEALTGIMKGAELVAEPGISQVYKKVSVEVTENV